MVPRGPSPLPVLVHLRRHECIQARLHIDHHNHPAQQFARDSNLSQNCILQIQSPMLVLHISVRQGGPSVTQVFTHNRVSCHHSLLTPTQHGRLAALAWALPGRLYRLTLSHQHRRGDGQVQRMSSSAPLLRTTRHLLLTVILIYRGTRLLDSCLRQVAVSYRRIVTG